MNRTSIEWVRGDDGSDGFTVNPIRARYPATDGDGHYCEKVSPGCANCYASRLQPRFGMPVFETQRRLDVTAYLDEVKLQSILAREKPCRVFLGDMTDIFGAWVPDAWLDKVFATMALAPQHTFMVLTKRAGRMREYFVDRPKQSVSFCREWAVTGVVQGTHGKSDSWLSQKWPGWPLPNVWLGVSVENQHFADERIPLLMQTPAAIRFASAEPLLEEVRMVPWLGYGVDLVTRQQNTSRPLDWVIVGGESGRHARPFHVEWASSLVRQCAAAGVACFVKQLGADPRWGPDGWQLDMLRNSKGGDLAEWPDYYVGDLKVRQFPKVSA